MINKGKGKLKWERDMPRDIEEKLEVINMMVIVIAMVGKGNFVRKTNSCFFINTLGSRIIYQSQSLLLLHS